MSYLKQMFVFLMLALALWPIDPVNANNDPLVCTPDLGAKGCTIFTKCRKTADLWVACKNKQGTTLDGYISSSTAKLDRLRLNFQTSGSSRIENGKFVEGTSRDLKTMSLDITKLPFTVEDLYYKRDKVNKYLKETYNLPAVVREGEDQQSGFQFILSPVTSVYKDPMASVIASPSSSTTSNGLRCSWSGNEPTLIRPKCSNTPGVCEGIALCWSGTSAKDNPPRSYQVSCDGLADGRCPSASDCASAPAPTAHSGMTAKCVGSVSQQPQTFIPGAK